MVQHLGDLAPASRTRMHDPIVHDRAVTLRRDAGDAGFVSTKLPRSAGGWLPYIKSPVFRRGVVVGVLLCVLGYYVLDESPLADWIVQPLLVRDTAGPADAIVVAGAGLVGPCEPNLSTLRRAMLAVDVWKQGRAPVIVFTGGVPPDLPCSVADVTADIARSMGVPQSQIRVEGTSRSTRENALFAAPVLEGLDARRILLVTDRLHMVRASLAFASLGYEVERATVPVYATHHGNVDMLLGGLREYAALAYYRVRGWLSTAQELPEAGLSGSFGAGAFVVPASFTSQSPAASSLVILGASYAEGWRPAEIAGMRVLNAGITGQQSFELAERFTADVVEHQPRAVVVWGFINDIFRAPDGNVDLALQRMQTSYDTMIALGRTSGIEVILATEVPITYQDQWRQHLMHFAGWILGKESYQDRINAHVRTGNAWLRDTATRERLLLLDFEQVVADTSGFRRREFAAADGSHLTEEAYRALTEYAAPTLERHFQAASRASHRPGTIPF